MSDVLSIDRWLAGNMFVIIVFVVQISFTSHGSHVIRELVLYRLCLGVFMSVIPLVEVDIR